MKSSEIYSRVDRYLRGNDTRPRIVNFQSRSSLVAFRDHFNVGNAVFKTPSDYSKPDEDMQLENLYAEIHNTKEKLFLIGFTSQLKLKGRQTLTQFFMQMAQTSLSFGKLVLVCYRCEDFLNFTDPRTLSLVYQADDESDIFPGVQFIGETITIQTDIKAISGIENLGRLFETITSGTIYIRTRMHSSNYPDSMISIDEMMDPYAVLIRLDPNTSTLPEGLGSSEQWAYALKEVTTSGSWDNVFKNRFGGKASLEIIPGIWKSLSENEHWLYLVALKLYGSQKNDYLNYSAKAATSINDFVHRIFRSILEEDWNTATFKQHYQERKQLLQQMISNQDDAEIIDYIKMTKVYKKDGIRYLTNNTKLEREAIIDSISWYTNEYTHQELIDILREVYPDLASYLKTYSFPDNAWLDSYFREYRYSKVLNSISTELMEMAHEQAVSHDFLKLVPRIAVIDSIPKDSTFLYFVDALGVEFIPFILEKCREYNIRASEKIARCELPSLTRCNKDFFESYPESQRTKVKELDEIIHQGKENYNYQVTKTPIHLIRELEIIDEVIKNAIAKLKSQDQFKRIVISSDHGATRMAVINENIVKQEVNSKGTHCGRVCEYNDNVISLPCVIHEGEYCVLASYDRFNGGQTAIVEAHGGGTLEEVIVPIIVLSKEEEPIEVQVESKVIEYSFKQPPVLKIFSKTGLEKVSVLINEKWYSANPSIDKQNFSFTLTGLKKGQYTARLYADGAEVAEGLSFELKSKAGSSTGKGGIL